VAQRKTIDDMLAAARARLARVTPAEAAAAQAAGALIVDTRDSGDRAAEGVIPDSIWFPRNVLEWRADPTSEAADPRIAGTDRRLIVVCNDGYSSSIAAATLQDLGCDNATDLIGGYRAWRADRRPIVNLEDER
jgi:rhodanese-related sulfurtransferase